MELQAFIQNFANQFDETDANNFLATTEFKQLKEWSSLIALSVMAMADEEYNVKLKGNDIKSAFTIEDLYNVVKSRI
jgi:acyl carrier protein